MPEPPRDLTIFIMSSIFLFDEISVFVPDPKIILCIPSLAVLTAAVNPYGINPLLIKGVSTIFINGNSTFTNGPRSLPRNPSDSIVLDTWVFDNFMNLNVPFMRTLQRPATCLSVNNELCGKVVSSVPIISDANLIFMPVACFAADFNLCIYVAGNLIT